MADVTEDMLTRLEHQINRQFDELKESVKELADTVGGLGREVAVLKDRGDRVARLEGRVEELERWKAYVFGASAVIGAVFGTGSYFLSRYLNH